MTPSEIITVLQPYYTEVAIVAQILLAIFYIFFDRH
jgi:hypothetical protein